MFRAGMPAAIAPAGTFRTTTALAPIVASSPTITAPRTFAPAPTFTRLPRMRLVGLQALIVDDNTSNRQILTQHLNSWGVEVVATESSANALAVLNKVTDGAVRNVLVVTEHDDELSWKSLRNVPFVHLLAEDQLNTYDVLASDYLVFTKAALDAFVERGSQ